VTLQDLANIAQLVGVLAVMVSLFYVGSQIRQNTSAVRSSTAQAVHDNYASWYMALSHDAELTRILLAGLRDYTSLPEIDRARVLASFMAFLSYTQNAFYQWRDGSLSPQLWVGWEALVMNVVGSPGGRQFSKERRYVFGDEFQDHVVNVIMKTTPNPLAKPLGAFKIG